MMTRRALVGFIFINIFVSLVVAVLIIVIWSSTTSTDQTIVTRIVPITVAGQADTIIDTSGQVPSGALEGTVSVLTATIDAQRERLNTQAAVLATAGLLQPTETPRPVENAGSSGNPTLPPEVLEGITLPAVAGNTGGGSSSTTSTSGDGGTIDDGCTRYTVVAGDSCLLIAERFDVSVADIISINGGINSNCTNLRTDQEILIPGDSCQPPPTATLQPSPTRTPFPIGTFSITNTPAPTATNAEVEIVQILSYGDINNERVELRNTGSGVVEMAGWTLQDDDGNVFVFPDFRLQPQAIIRIVSRVDDNTAGALYWNQQVAVWQEGDVATLLNVDGDVQSSYEVGSESIDFGE